MFGRIAEVCADRDDRDAVRSMADPLLAASLGEDGPHPAGRRTGRDVNRALPELRRTHL